MSNVIVVGGGISGLTAAAYLARSGYETLLIEKESKCGGLIGSFERDGFIYDAGIRATENSGILFPMLKQLGLDIEFLENPISLGFEDKVISIDSSEPLNEYQKILNSLYPESITEISEIISQIKKTMNYMEVQYDIDNPAFLDPREDWRYMVGKVLPWAVRYVFTVPKINRLNVPVVPFLERYTKNQALIDIITQHFFSDMPAYFALSYMKIYLDYHYPRGGTGVIPLEMAAYIRQQGGVIKTGTKITHIEPEKKYLLDEEGVRYDYDQLVWAADLTSLYRLINTETIENTSIKQAVEKRKSELDSKLGNDSVFTLYLGVDIDPSYFREKSTGHFFYTPSKIGETSAGPKPYTAIQEEIKEWLRKFGNLTTYEISIPVLRDPSLAPSGKTGLIISALFDYQITKRILEQGWYDEFRDFLGEQIIDVLDRSIYPGLKESLVHSFTVTPISIERRTDNIHGAITGWAYTNDPMPAENRLPKIFSSTETPIPNVTKAGQWTYSPSGMPISILTGKLASDRVINNLKRG